MGFPEAIGTEEVASEVVYKFLERELELEGAKKEDRVSARASNW